MSNRALYQQPMASWPGLSAYKSSQRLPEDDLEMFYYEAGRPTQPTLMMIHGLGDEADTWRHVITPLADHFHVIAPDLPGFGRSAKPRRPLKPDFMMGSLTRLMDALKIEKAIFMGSSLGGILSQGLAVHHPDRVMGLVLVDGSLLQAAPMEDRGIKMMSVPLLGEFLYTRLRRDPQAAFDSLRIVYHDLDGLPEADRDFLFQRVNRRVWSKGQRRGYFSTLRNLLPWVNQQQAELPGKLAQVDIPTLVIYGEHDAIYPASNADAIIKAQPRAEAVQIDGAAHLPQQEDPPAFLNAVTPWLQAHFLKS